MSTRHPALGRAWPRQQPTPAFSAYRASFNAEGRRRTMPNRGPAVARKDLRIAVCIDGLIDGNARACNCCSAVRNVEHPPHRLGRELQAGA